MFGKTLWKQFRLFLLKWKTSQRNLVLRATLVWIKQFTRLQVNATFQRDCGMAKSSERIKWQDSNTPTTTPYKAFSGALLLWGGNVRGAAGSDKSKHLEYTAYFWKGNINNIADFSWVITLSPPDLCFYPTGGLFKPCLCSNPWCIQV